MNMAARDAKSIPISVSYASNRRYPSCLAQAKKPEHGAPGDQREHQHGGAGQQLGDRPAPPRLGDLARLLLADVASSTGCAVSMHRSRACSPGSAGSPRSGTPPPSRGPSCRAAARSAAAAPTPRARSGELVVAGQALKQQQVGRVAEVRNERGEQLARHLLDVERVADPGERVVEHLLAHDGRVDEPLRPRRRDADQRERGQVGPARAHRMDGHHRLGRPAVAGLDGQIALPSRSDLIASSSPLTAATPSACRAPFWAATVKSLS